MSLLGPEGPEVSCEECFERLDEYVDSGRGGRGQPDSRHARAPRGLPGLPRGSRQPARTRRRGVRHAPRAALTPGMTDSQTAAKQAFLLLRIAFTVAPILFGLDKFAEVLTDNWSAYLAPEFDDIIPGSADDAMWSSA